MFKSDKECLEEEKQMDAEFEQLLKDKAYLFKYLWRYGDGNGGHIFQKIREVVDIRPQEYPNPNRYKKKKITHSLQKEVFERDAYRCKLCGSHIDLCIDHILPERLGGSLDINNLQTLCRSCNSKKGTKAI